MTDEERIEAYNNCMEATYGPVHRAGAGFITSALTGNFVGAVGSWIDMIYESTKTDNNCANILTPEQRERLKQEAARLHAIYRMDKIDKEPK